MKAGVSSSWASDLVDMLGKCWGNFGEMRICCLGSLPFSIDGVITFINDLCLSWRDDVMASLWIYLVFTYRFIDGCDTICCTLNRSLRYLGLAQAE